MKETKRLDHVLEVAELLGKASRLMADAGYVKYGHSYQVRFDVRVWPDWMDIEQIVLDLTQSLAQ